MNDDIQLIITALENYTGLPWNYLKITHPGIAKLLEQSVNIISREDLIEISKKICDRCTMGDKLCDAIMHLLSAQPETNCSEIPNNSDTISRQAAIDVIDAILPVEPMKNEYTQGITCGAALAIEYVKQLPSAQPERTCVNCGRTANNGGWYADGGTRCPIEEHYALPKDGYCHLWEKRNVTDDDYPERREE